MKPVALLQEQLNQVDRGLLTMNAHLSVAQFLFSEYCFFCLKCFKTHEEGQRIVGEHIYRRETLIIDQFVLACAGGPGNSIMIGQSQAAGGPGPGPFKFKLK